MSKWVCYECGGTDVWELSWVCANRISWMLMYDEDVYTDFINPTRQLCNANTALVDILQRRLTVVPAKHACLAHIKTY